MNPGPRDVYETFFRFQEALRDMLTDLHSSQILPDSRDFSRMNRLLDQCLQLSGTRDTDIARYPVWRYVADLVEDLEPVNPGIWVDRGSEQCLEKLSLGDLGSREVSGNPIHTAQV